MSSGCGDVLSLEDLKTAKLHQIFEAEVITGRSGGTASGAPIDYAVNQVTGQTQKTLPAVLRDAGFRPASFTFTTGGTLNAGDSDVAVLWPVASGGDGDYYVWKGALPKTVPASSTPASSGGVSDSGWMPVGDIRLRSDLSSAATGVGDALITVKQDGTLASARTQHDKNKDVINLKDYGAVGDGTTDDSAAINAALVAAVGKRLDMPAGKYRCLSAINIPSNTEWRGQPGAEVFLDPAMTLGASFGGLGRAVYSQNTSNVYLENIKFSSLKTGLTKSITVGFLSVAGLHVKGCTFTDFGNSTYYAQGLIAFQSSDIEIENSIFNNCSGDGAALASNCVRYKIVANTFSNNGDWGCALVEGCNFGVVEGNIFFNNVSTATGVDRCQYVQFTGNTMHNNEHGVRVCEFAVSTDKCLHITIQGNNISLSNYGISIENMNQPYGHFSVTGNTINGSNQQGIQVINSQMGAITGNSIYSSNNAAILLQNSSASKATGGVAITGNSINSCVYGIQEVQSAGNLTVNTVSGNVILNATTQRYNLTANSPYMDAGLITYATFSVPLNFPTGISQNTATAGGTTPPTQVQGYIPVYLGGTMKKVPYYN